MKENDSKIDAALEQDSVLSSIINLDNIFGDEDENKEEEIEWKHLSSNIIQTKIMESSSQISDLLLGIASASLNFNIALTISNH